VPAPVVVRRKNRERLAWALLTIAILAALSLAVFHFRQTSTEQAAIRLSVSAPEKATFADAFAISPDGRRLALVVFAAGVGRSLWVRRLDSLEAKPLPGTEGA